MSDTLILDQPYADLTRSFSLIGNPHKGHSFFWKKLVCTWCNRSYATAHEKPNLILCFQIKMADHFKNNEKYIPSWLLHSKFRKVETKRKYYILHTTKN